MAPLFADRPAEQDVARRLQPTLAGDDPLAVRGVRTRFEEPFEDGGLGLLDLEEERVVVAGALEQRHVRPEADAADADDLQRRIDDPVAIEQDAAILLETLPVSRSGVVGEPERELLGMDDHRGPVDDPTLPSGELR